MVGFKCGNCGSYNTVRCGNEEVPEDEAGQGADGGEGGRMNMLLEMIRMIRERRRQREQEEDQSSADDESDEENAPPEKLVNTCVYMYVHNILLSIRILGTGSEFP